MSRQAGLDWFCWDEMEQRAARRVGRSVCGVWQGVHDDCAMSAQPGTRRDALD